MSQTIEAIFEGGVFKPLQPVALRERQTVHLIVHETDPVANRELMAWEQVYAGLSDEEVAEIDDIVQDRSRFMRPPR